MKRQPLADIYNSPPRKKINRSPPTKEGIYRTFARGTLYRAGEPGNPVFLTPNLKVLDSYAKARNQNIFFNNHRVKLLDLSKIEPRKINGFCIMKDGKRIDSTPETAQQERDYYNALFEMNFQREADGFYTPEGGIHEEAVLPKGFQLEFCCTLQSLKSRTALRF